MPFVRSQIRDNLGISADNQSALPKTLFIPPLRMLASWLFKVSHLFIKQSWLKFGIDLEC